MYDTSNKLRQTADWFASEGYRVHIPETTIADQLRMAADEIDQLRTALTEIAGDDAGQEAYGYTDIDMALDRCQRIARNDLKPTN